MVGRFVVKVGVGAFLTVVVCGSAWMLSDLAQTYLRGEIDDVAAWAITAFAAVLSIAIGASSGWALWRLITGRFEIN